MGFKYSIKGRPSISDKLVANLFTWEDLCQDKKVGLQRIKDLYSSQYVPLEDITAKALTFALIFWLMSRQWLINHRLFENVKDYSQPLIRLTFLKYVAKYYVSKSCQLAVCSAPL